MAAVLLLLGSGMAVFAVELSSTLGAVVFDPTMVELSGEESRLSAFHLMGNLQADFDLSNSLSLAISLEHDPILLTRIIPLVGFTTDVISLNIGPYMGFLDYLDPEINPGISMALDVAAPGIVFGSLRFDTTLSSGSIAPENFIQKYWNMRLGFWVPRIIFSLGAENRSLFEQRGSEIYSNEWTRYILSADFFQKNVPRTFRFDFGLQQLSWLLRSLPDEGYQFNSLFVGVEFTSQINLAVKIILGGEASVYSWDARQGIGEASYTNPLLFSVRFGTVWSIGK
jgi:hypothetical protein